MKKTILFLGAVCILSSFTVLNPVITDTTSEEGKCPKCTKEFKEHSTAATKVYADAVEKAADKLKAGTISKDKFAAECSSAQKVMDKAEAEYQTTYHKCCLDEMKADKEKKQR